MSIFFRKAVTALRHLNHSLRFRASSELLLCVCLSQHYFLKYRCDDCYYSSTNYKSVYGFNETSVNITVNDGAAYTVWIQVHTRYGSGKWAQTTAVTPSTIGKVSTLSAEADSNIPTLVHLTWGPPSSLPSPIMVSNVDEVV